MTSNNIVITDVCYCGHKRNCHFMGGPCYFPYVFDGRSSNSKTSPLQPPITNDGNGPFNKSKKCDCKEHRSNLQALI